MRSCCNKDHQTAAMELEIGYANQLVWQEMDDFSLDIQKVLLDRAVRKLDAGFPLVFLGALPRATLQGDDENDDEYTATIDWKCLNADKMALTCSGRAHSITGNGRDGRGDFRIVEGKWSPLGYSYWIEERIRNGKEEWALVTIHWAETAEATVTVYDKEGGTARTMRMMKLSWDSGSSCSSLCPLVGTAIQNKIGGLKK